MKRFLQPFWSLLFVVAVQVLVSMVAVPKPGYRVFQISVFVLVDLFLIVFQIVARRRALRVLEQARTLKRGELIRCLADGSIVVTIWHGGRGRGELRYKLGEK